MVLGVSLIAVPVVGLWQWQNIFDWTRLRDYTPPPAIASLAEADSMNDKARRIFYVNRPEMIADTANFRKNCSSNEQTIVLGCYQSGQNGIYIFDVTDERLGGIEEVTAAHEMLHAAYDRLGSQDKDYVDGLIQDFYDNGLSDERVKNTIDSYKKTEPNELLNEMHSIFGTEIASLPAPLENYYKRYFNNRAAVVAFSQRYESEFTSRAERAKQYETQINELQRKIEAEEANLKTQLAGIEAEQARLDSFRDSDQFEAYNGGVAGYNAQVQAYNNGIARYKRDVDRYNSLIAQYNDIAGELRQLYGAIDTRLQTQTTR